MPLVTRSGKGSKLTIAEMDGNLEYLESNGFVNGAYTQTYIGTGAIIDVSGISVDPNPIIDAALGTYTVSPIGGGGSGAQLEVVVEEAKGQLVLTVLSVINGGLGYEANDVLTFSSNDVGGTLDETISLTLDITSVDVTVSSSISVGTDSITLDTTTLEVTGNMQVTGSLGINSVEATSYIQAQDIYGNASLDFLAVSSPFGETVISFQNLPTTDPEVAGQLWVDAANGYVLKVSQGV